MTQGDQLSRLPMSQKLLLPLTPALAGICVGARSGPHLRQPPVEVPYVNADLLQSRFQVGSTFKNASNEELGSELRVGKCVVFTTALLTGVPGGSCLVRGGDAGPGLQAGGHPHPEGGPGVGDSTASFTVLSGRQFCQHGRRQE